MAPKVIAEVNDFAKYRVVDDPDALDMAPVIEHCIGADAMGSEIWTRLTPQSDSAALWTALQALTRTTRALVNDKLAAKATGADPIIKAATDAADPSRKP